MAVPVAVPVPVAPGTEGPSRRMSRRRRQSAVSSHMVLVSLLRLLRNYHEESETETEEEADNLDILSRRRSSLPSR